MPLIPGRRSNPSKRLSAIRTHGATSMPADAQQRAADGIRKAQELFKLDTLPQKIGFGDMRGAYGMYSETTRTLTLSRTRCKDPEEAFSAMIHELTHYYDHVSGHVAESVYKQALKELGLRANSRQAGNLAQLVVGATNRKDVNDPAEIMAFSIERAVSGNGNELAKKILEIIRRAK